MSEQTIIALLTVLFLSVFLKIEWLTVLLLVFVIVYSLAILGASPSRPAPGGSGSGKPKQVLHPVIYEDIGGPALYPSEMSVKIFTKAEEELDAGGKFSQSGGVVARSFVSGVKKLFKEL